MGQKKTYTLFAIAAAGALALSGCGRTTEPKKTDTENVVSNVLVDEEGDAGIEDTPKPVKPQADISQHDETESERARKKQETETESESEKMLTSTDVLEKYRYQPSEGSIVISTVGKDNEKWAGSYMDDGNCLCILEPSKEETLYLGRVSYKNVSGWEIADVSYEGFLDLTTQKNCSYAGEGKVNGETCQEVDVMQLPERLIDTVMAILKVYAKEIKRTDEVSCRYFLDDSGKLKVLDITIDVSGTSYEIMFVPEIVLESPIKIPDDVVMEATSGYEPGSMSMETNTYVNPFFLMQLNGGDVVMLDKEKAGSIGKDSTSGERQYNEEAYGTCDGGIVNITSVYADSDVSEELILSSYLDDCQAQMKGSIEETKIAGRDACRMSALINDTATYTYCVKEKSIALLITIYYKDSATMEKIMSRIVSVSEDPDWVEDSYFMKEYEVTTPDGFYIDTENSSDVSVNMLDKECDLYIFIYDDASIYEERNADIAGSDMMVTVMENEEPISCVLGEGSYLTLNVTQDGTSFRQHEFLIQSGEDVLKYIVMSDGSGDDDNRCREVLDMALENTKYWGESDETESDMNEESSMEE